MDRIGDVGGTERWTFETEGKVWSSPTVVDGTVYVGSYDHNVYALSSTTGTKQWTFDAGDWVMSSPTAFNGSLFVVSNDGTVYALDSTTGDQQWKFNIGSPVRSSPTVAAGLLFVGSRDNHVYALDCETGSQLWCFETDGWVVSSPTVADETVYVGSYDNYVYALNTVTGKKKWAVETYDKVWSSPVVNNNTVFVGSDDNQVYALDAVTGEEAWSFETNGGVRSSPAVINGTVFCGSNDQKVYALDSDTGEKQWSFLTDSSVQSSPTVVENTVFVGSNDGYVYALDSATGEREWLIKIGGRILSSPTVVDGTLFVGTNQNRVYALDTGLDGSSIDSRVTLQTLGHHDRSIRENVHPDEENQTLQTNTPSEQTVARSPSVNLSPPDVSDHANQIPPTDAGASPPRWEDIDFAQLSVKSQIGHGGQAAVYEASVEHVDELDRIAVRAPPAIFSGQTAELSSYGPFLDRAERWSMIDRRERTKPRWSVSDHIVGIIAVGDQLPWVAMEYMDDATLADRLDNDTELDLAQTLWIAEKIAQGLEVAHNEGAVHLDLKPENVLFRKTGQSTWSMPKIADWGVARALADQSESVDWISAPYAAPEILSPDSFGTPDTLTDVYQLGAVLYAMLTGRAPYEHGDTRRVLFEIVDEEPPPPPSEYAPDISRAVDQAVTTALSPNKRDRYGSAREFKQTLRALRTGNTVPSVLKEDSSSAIQSATDRPTENKERNEKANQPEGHDKSDETNDNHRTTTDVELLGEVTQYNGETVVIRCEDQTERTSFVPDLPPGTSLTVGTSVSVEPYEWESDKATITHVYDDDRFNNEHNASMEGSGRYNPARDVASPVAGEVQSVFNRLLTIQESESAEEQSAFSTSKTIPRALTDAYRSYIELTMALETELTMIENGTVDEQLSHNELRRLRTDLEQVIDSIAVLEAEIKEAYHHRVGDDSVIDALLDALESDLDTVSHYRDILRDEYDLR